MQTIIIVGAGRFGREICCWLEQMFDPATMRIKGFLDDTLAAAPCLNEHYPYPLLGAIDAYVPSAEDAFLLAIAEPADKLRIAAGLQAKGAVFFTLIHPTAVLARTATVGQGAVICPFAMLSADSVVADFVTINSYSGIGHDAVIGTGTTLSSHVDITGGVIVEAGVFFGSSAVVLPQLRIGSGARVGAGAIVMRPVAPGSTVYAMPAKKL
ncbi:acetyltransferase [Janthinobacterium sp.]|uniref:acetyltransferase n=1 Tax=Janthinobacterium sp. TaxID=1871054 RepID=UPI002608CF6E|nr:acetyltransferase [Janthinobacterium sp.]